MIVIDRFDPRLDRDELKEIYEDFIKNKSYFPSNWKQFETELNKRVLDLQYRNSMVVAKEEGKIVGWGTYTVFRDYLGNERAIIHQILTKKEDSFKKGIEEMIIKEIQLYIQRTLKLDKVYFFCPDDDAANRSIFMKLGVKKSKFFIYEKEI